MLQEGVCGGKQRVLAAVLQFNYCAMRLLVKPVSLLHCVMHDTDPYMHTRSLIIDAA